jgi:hypothetical protein
MSRAPAAKGNKSTVRLSLLNAGDFPLTEPFVDVHLEGLGVAVVKLKGANVVDVLICVHTTKPDDPDGGKMQGLGHFAGDPVLKCHFPAPAFRNTIRVLPRA